jgi:hypothetical protein
MVRRSIPEYEAAVAIGAFDESLVAHLQKHARMAERVAKTSGAAVAANAGIVNRNDFGGFGRHDRRSLVAAGS